MSMDIVVYIILFVICLYMAIKVHKRNKEKKDGAGDFQESIISPIKELSMSVYQNKELAGDEKNTLYRERKEKSYADYQVLTKRKKTGIVAQFLYTCIDLESAPSLYELEKKFDTYDEYRKELLLMGDSELYVKQGIVLYNKLRKEGVYTTRRATIKNDAHFIIEHPVITNKSLYIIQACDAFEAYWDSELTKYTRKNAYLNRIEYLINYAAELSKKKYIKDNPPALQRVQQLKLKYTEIRIKA